VSALDEVLAAVAPAMHDRNGLNLSDSPPERWRLAGWLGGVSPLRCLRRM